MAIDWTKPMQQTFEFYEVDPGTWRDKKKCDFITASSINRDLDTDTLGSASIDVTQPITECYIRIYLAANQNGVKEKHPLGTYLVQAPSINFNGKRSSMTADGYTPLIELKETMPPVGFFIPKLTDGMDSVYDLTSEHARAPVVTGAYHKTWYWETGYEPDTDHPPAKTWINEGTEDAHLGDIFYDNRKYPNDVYIWSKIGSSDYRWRPTTMSDLTINKDTTRLTTNFVADTEDTWFKFLSDLLSSLGKRFDLDEMGRIRFETKKELDTMQPIWTYNDDNSSILDPNIDLECDLFGIPNVVEVIYTNNTKTHRYIAENHDPNSPLSIENRGRRILHRVTDPGFVGTPSQEDAAIQTKNYAKKLLKELSNIERTITYTHGYCPVRLDDCVRLNYSRAGLIDIKARVVSQSIRCIPGCPVSEKAVYSTKLLNENYITVTPKEDDNQ